MRDSIFLRGPGAVNPRSLSAIGAALIFSVAPILSLFATNLGEFESRLALGALLVSFGVAVVMLLLVGFLTGSLIAAGIAVWGWLLLFFSYGHLYEWARATQVGNAALVRHRYLLPVFAGLWAAWTLLVFIRKERVAWLSMPLLAMSAVTFALPAFQIGSYYLSVGGALGNPADLSPSEASAPVVAASERPDVYYIVLDGYGRSDILREIYGYDNSAFLMDLEDLGFYVADRAVSNYSVTTLSLASSLNMTYLDEVAEAMPGDSRNHRPLVRMIRESVVEDFLRGRGYDVVSFETGYARTIDREDDVFIEAPFAELAKEHRSLLGWHPSVFDVQLLETTAARSLLDLKSISAEEQEQDPFGPELYWEHYSRLQNIFKTLTEIPQWDGTYFVVAHIIAPHPPFVFSSDGSFVPHSGAFTLEETDCCDEQEYIAGYRQQADYVSDLMTRTVRAILEDSDREPVIIIQGDHGPAAHWGPTLAETNVQERMGILNAIYLPGKDTEGLYRDMTPVNNFRIVLKDEFDMMIEPLPDRSYFSPAQDLYDFQEVTALLDD